mmetsp:Transcript_33323/g.72070  ORF Transcript_33323/g.72070 Transcript_33323/m.72070 type:complete len:106 (-) Transcript_33323:210-527(-)
MTNAAPPRLINSDEVQSVLKPIQTGASLVIPKKTNPLRVSSAKIALNPYHATVKDREAKKAAASGDARKKIINEKRGVLKARSKTFGARKRAFYEASSSEGEVKF